MPHQCTNCGRTFPDGSKEMLSGCPDCGGNKFKFDPGGRDDTESGSAAEPASSPDGSPSEPSSPGERSSGAGSSPPTDDEEPFADHEWPDTASTEPPDAHDKTGPAGQPTVDADDTAPRDATASGGETTQTPTDTGASPDDGGEFEYSSAAERSAAERSPDTATDRPGARSGDRPHANVETTGGREADAENSAQASARSEVVSGDELPDHTADSGPSPPHDSARDGETTPSDASDSETTDPEFERIREELNEQFESIRIVRPGEYELNLVELYDREEFIISLREDGRYVIEMPDAWDTGTE